MQGAKVGDLCDSSAMRSSKKGLHCEGKGLEEEMGGEAGEKGLVLLQSSGEA